MVSRLGCTHKDVVEGEEAVQALLAKETDAGSLGWIAHARRALLMRGRRTEAHKDPD